ncbi:hypothetical protein V8E52_004631 [Russula decolorans]
MRVHNQVTHFTHIRWKVSQGRAHDRSPLRTTLSKSKAGERSNSTARCSGDLPTDKLLRQPDLVYTVQDALALISQPQSVQVEPSDPSKASQQVTVLIETFPPVLIVYLKRFLYDIVAGGVVKNCKPVQFSPGLKIPPVKAENRSWLGCLRHHGTYSRTTHGASAIHAQRSALPLHHDSSASGGHYTVDMLHWNAHEGSGEAWLRIDDDIVQCGTRTTSGQTTDVLIYSFIVVVVPLITASAQT